MKVMIIEDEKLALSRIRRFVLNADDNVEIVAETETIRESIAVLKVRMDLDLILCDIHLADGISFEIFERVEVNVPVIFTTAYDEYSIRAFEVNSVDYLLKPIKEEDVERALNKYKKLHQKSDFDLGGLQQLIKEAQPREKMFLIKSGIKMVPKKESEMALIYMSEKVLQFADRDGRSFLIDGTLDELMKNELNANRFFRINRKQIVNKEFIESIRPHYNQRLSLNLKIRVDQELIISREKVNDFKKWFLK